MIPALDDAVRTEALSGGMISTVQLATHADGRRYVVKTNPSAAAGLFAAEAEGLAALRRSGAVATPEVIDVGRTHLVLEALEPAPADDAFAERLGHAVARLHAVTGERFGWHEDNWLGSLPQVNTWTEDGHAFFAEHRVLRYLPHPAVRAALDTDDRTGIERLCTRLPELVPAAEPVLTHGDLWPGNILATAEGAPALIDPAVSWSWAGRDLSAMLASGVPERFFAAYHEVHPPQPDWRDCLQLLHIVEHLSMLAHGVGEHVASSVEAIRTLLRRFG